MNNGSSCRGCQPEVPVMVGTVPDPLGVRTGGASVPRFATAAVVWCPWPGSRRSLAFRCGRLGGEPAACYPASAAVDQVEGQGSDGGERCQRAQESERPGHGDPERPPAGAEATRQAGRGLEVMYQRLSLGAENSQRQGGVGRSEERRV